MQSEVNTGEILGKAANTLKSVSKIGEGKVAKNALRLDDHFMETTMKRKKYLSTINEKRKKDQELVDQIQEQYNSKRA